MCALQITIISFSQNIEEKGMEKSYLVKPKGIALVWPEGLPVAYDGTNRKTLRGFYENLIEAIPKEIEITLIVKSQKIANSIKEVYNRKNVKTLVASRVKDIWIRDWAPLNLYNKGSVKSLKFKYQPAYLNIGEFEGDNESGHLISNSINSGTHPDFILDGGNFTYNGKGIGFITNRVISDNETFSIEEIEAIFNNNFGINKLIILPVEPEDETGHIDGMVQFINPYTVAIGSYPSNTDADEFLNKVAKLVEEEGIVNVIRISNGKIIEEKNEGIASAVGNHINFLVLGNKIILPTYDGLDKSYLNEMEMYFNKENIIEINCTELARLGGVIHCVTWEYYDGQFLKEY